MTRAEHRRRIALQIGGALAILLAGWLGLKALGESGFAAREPEPQMSLTGEEIERKIRTAVTRQGDLLSVYDPLLQTLSVVPATSKWAVQCGLLGFKVRFAHDADESIEVAVSYISVSPGKCRDLAPAAARIVMEITGHAGVR